MISGPGKAPQRRTEHVESHTSHNGIPLTVVWPEKAANPTSQPPRTSIQIYDTITTPARSSPADREALAKTLESVLGPNNTGYPDRLDIYTISAPEEADEERRVALCIEHQKVELLRRKSTDGEQERLFMLESYKAKDVILHHRFMIIIDKPQDLWEEEGMLFVFFDPVEPEAPDERAPDVEIRRVKGLINIPAELDYFRKSMEFNRINRVD